MPPRDTSERRLRIGIDVGGTFTDLVALDDSTGQVVCQLKVPTTHRAREGVAAGVRQALRQAAAELALRPGEVVFIAHATTQATNALLEGDVAPVGILGLGGRHDWLARRATRLRRLELAPGHALDPAWEFVADGDFRPALDRLVKKGCRAIVATQAFGVDAPEREQAVVEAARAAGLAATAGHEVSQLYGLRTRTRTAAINACILPKMVETAEMTARAVQESGVAAPLMIMRSDGGVMSVDEMRRRPILTILSGPAAGVAGALLHEKVSTGIFLEFGGTSTDISVIRNGRPMMKPARIGGHRTFLTTLDVRTVALGGGSMVVLEGRRISRVGPRSAHIAGLPYTCFGPAEAARLAPVTIPGDPGEYAAISMGGVQYALTTTCAANALGLVPEGDYASGSEKAARAAFAELGHDAARRVLELACRPAVRVCEDLIAEYRLERPQVELVGGGGAAGALLPFLAERLRLPFRIARRAEVISTIGVALAMVRESVERNIANPTPDDVLRLRREAEQAVLKQGAQPGTIEVEVHVDPRRQLVSAVAVGSTEIRRREAEGDAGAPEAAARRVLGGDPQAAGKTARFTLYRRGPNLALVDADAIVRFQGRGYTVEHTAAGSLKTRLARALESFTSFGDAGRLLPEVYLVWGGRLLDLSSLASEAQVLALAEVEARGLAESDDVYLLVKER